MALSRRSRCRLPAALRHPVVILRENRTFDELLGDVGDAANSSVRADPDFARFGLHGLASTLRAKFAERDVAVTPNLHAIAATLGSGRQLFQRREVRYGRPLLALGQSIRMPGRWPRWRHRTLAERSAAAVSRPGRRLFFQGSTDPVPEQYPEPGTLWHHLQRQKFRSCASMKVHRPGARHAIHRRDPAAGSRSTGAPLPRVMVVRLPGDGRAAARGVPVRCLLCGGERLRHRTHRRIPLASCLVAADGYFHHGERHSAAASITAAHDGCRWSSRALTRNGTTFPTRTRTFPAC